MRLLLLVLIALVALIQYPLWMGRGGWFAVWDMQEQVASQRSINDGLRARNAALAAEVEDLRSGTEAAEERARGELGMLRHAEVFVHILPPEGKPPELKVTDSKSTEVKPAASAVKAGTAAAKPATAPLKPAAKPAQSAASQNAQPTAPPAGQQATPSGAQPAPTPAAKPAPKPAPKPAAPANTGTQDVQRTQ